MNMRSFIERYYKWNRVPVGDETGRFVSELAEDLGGEILRIASGEECLTWIVPPKWTVREAYLETIDGKRLADFRWNPLYLKSYSAPFSGQVSKEDLLAHVLSDRDRPEAILYDYRAQYAYGDRAEWGFSLPWNVVESLNETEYQVHIDTEFGEGTLDVLDLILPGESEETIFFAAHTCHPAQVNDGLACIAVLRELFRWLRERPDRQYTYRLILGPEYFAAAALLAHGRTTDALRAGFFFDMLGNGEQFAYSSSYAGDSLVDLAAKNVLRHQFGEFEEHGYRGLWGNDELFYDGPGYLIPTVGLARGYFDRYHTHFDDVERCDFAQLEQSVELLKTVVEVLEADCRPVRTYHGPLYLSRYDLYIDPNVDRKAYRSIQEIQILMDGGASCLQIAERLDVDVRFVLAFVAELERLGFVRTRDTTAEQRPTAVEAAAARG